MFLGAAAARTRNIRLGHGIVQMPPNYNHPARVAERIATLDLVSNGRVEFGTGEGATDTELDGFLTDQPSKKGAWEESTRECLRMMTLTPYPGYEGKYFSMPERNVIPKPLQKPHPPVWVAATRRETVMEAGRLGLGALGFGFETPEEARERVDRYYELIRGCSRPLGQAVNPALVTLGNLMCARTDDEAMAKGLSGAQFFGFSFAWSHGPMQHGRDHVFREFRRQQEGANAPEAEEPEDEALRSRLRAGRRGRFIGSTEYVRQNVRQYEDAHVDMLLFIVQCGDRKHEDVMQSLELFAREVMPEFKERHDQQQKWREKHLADVKFQVNSTI